MPTRVNESVYVQCEYLEMFLALSYPAETLQMVNEPKGVGCVWGEWGGTRYISKTSQSRKLIWYYIFVGSYQNYKSNNNKIGNLLN